MHLLRPLDLRCCAVFRALGVNALNVYWRKVRTPHLAHLLLQQQGIVTMALRRVAQDFGVDITSWIEQLQTEASATINTVPLRRLCTSASKIAMKYGHPYIGTEHLFLACLDSDPALLDHSSVAIASAIRKHLSILSRVSCANRDLTADAAVHWPTWAPKRILRVQDFPPELADDARIIVAVMSLYSRRQLSREPAVRFALARRPQNVEQLRRAIVEYFVSMAAGPETEARG